MACAAIAPPSIARAPRDVSLAPRSVPRVTHPRGRDRSAPRDGFSFRIPVRATRVLASADDSAPPRLVDPARASSGLGASGSAPPACARCGDTGASACRACQGTGALSPGGFHAKNHVDLRSVVGTNWTAHVRTEGWRHFEATEARPADKKANPPRSRASVRLTATCDRTVGVWVPVDELKDRVKWSAGWKQREELAWSGDPDSARGATATPKDGPRCPKCAGEGVETCSFEKCAAGAKREEEAQKKALVIRAATKKTRRAVKAARRAATEDGDAEAAAFVGRAKRALRESGSAKRAARRERRKRRSGRRDDEASEEATDASSSRSANDDEEDWGAAARRKRDAALEAFVRGVEAPNGPESRQ